MEVRTEILEDARAFVRVWGEVDSLRLRLGSAFDVLLSPVHFLASTDEDRRSCSVATWRGDELIGMLYATQHYVKGIPTGYAVGGDFSGRGLLLSSPMDERLVLRESMKRLTASGVHAMHLRLLPRESSSSAMLAPILPAIPGLKMKFLDAVIPGDLLLLKPDFEEFLAKLGKHTRRNIRAFTRKTEHAKIEFVPDLTRKEYVQAVQRLNSETDFPADPRRLERDERLLELHNGQRMGLRAADGTIVALLCGFRRGDRFYLLTQLNDAKYERLSLSLVLRAHTSRHLIEEGVGCLHFLGGSSLSFGRYCESETYRSIFVDRRSGVAAVLKIALSQVARLMRGLGRPIPETIALLCGGSLDDEMLAERTVLKPAAMLMRQRSQSRGSSNDEAMGAVEPGDAHRPLLRVSA